jgi:hypothetical protein
MASSQLFEQLLGSGTLAAGLASIAGGIQDTGADAADQTLEFADQAVEGTRFRPYAVRSASGNVGVEGDTLSLDVNPELSGITSLLRGGASDRFTEANRSIDDTAASIFDMMLAAQQPSFDRDRNALEQRLFAQGRSGIATDEFGSTPEMFTLEKAIAEAKNNLAVDARRLATTERASSGELGSLFLRDSFSPETALLAINDPAIQLGNLRQTSDIAGTNLASQLRLGGLNTQTNADLTASNLYGTMFQALAGIGQAAGARIDDVGFSGLFDDITSAFF